MLDVIADRAGQKGTGRWSLIEAQRLGAVANTIEAAVGARNLSAATNLREKLAERSSEKPVIDVSISDLHDALLAGKIIAYAQGFDLLAQASQEFDWQLDLASVARVWRAGCIIRSGMLDDIANALDASPNVPLMAVPVFRQRLADAMPALRRTVSAGVLAGLPVPALSNALSYRDQLVLPRGTSNMLQGLRDRFGQHGFERTDREGKGFHGPWI
jgi:6-phosphogluconate dehydrogenase